MYISRDDGQRRYYKISQYGLKELEKENNFGANTVQRNHANKNTPNNNSDFMLIFAIESIENTIKKRY